MPYENEHACRLEDPDKFQDDSFRRTKRKHKGKEYSVIMGRLKGEDTMTEQAYRYAKKIWTASQAKSHCKDHDGSFEAAKKEDGMDNIERKSIQIELKADKPGSFTARIATLNVVDKQGDETLPGAIEEGKEILVSAYMHGSWTGGKDSLPIGKAVLRETETEILGDGEFNLKTETGREHYETIKFSGGLQEWSYGFKVDESTEEQRDGHRVRILEKITIFEMAPVLKGAGTDTGTLSIKNDKTTYVDEAEMALAAVTDLVTRTKEINELRLKEGRVLSTVNRKRIKTLLESLSEVTADLKELLDATEPKDDKALSQAYLILAKVKRELAEINA